MEKVVQEFINAYYTCLMTNRQNAIGMYKENSFMSYAGENIQGLQNIQKKIESFSFKTIKVSISLNIGPFWEFQFLFFYNFI